MFDVAFKFVVPPGAHNCAGEAVTKEGELHCALTLLLAKTRNKLENTAILIFFKIIIFLAPNLKNKFDNPNKFKAI